MLDAGPEAECDRDAPIEVTEMPDGIADESASTDDLCSA